MRSIWVNITGPHDATEDDLINGGREAVARAGYEVGWVSNAKVSPNSTSSMLLECDLEVDDRLYAEYERTNEIDLDYGGYAVWAYRE